MTDIEKGGYTAFPYVKTRIPPIKNGAAFWYNLNPLGVGDSYTKHAACPVILGEKWVGNKWISEPDQMFIRKCPIGVKFKEEDTDSYYKDFF
jgi:prolyl 4-hydroxylase